MDSLWTSPFNSICFLSHWITTCIKVWIFSHKFCMGPLIQLQSFCTGNWHGRPEFRTFGYLFCVCLLFIRLVTQATWHVNFDVGQWSLPPPLRCKGARTHVIQKLLTYMYKILYKNVIFLVFLIPFLLLSVKPCPNGQTVWWRNMKWCWTEWPNSIRPVWSNSNYYWTQKQAVSMDTSERASQECMHMQNMFDKACTLYMYL